jgi:hypothetical protein
MNIVNTKQGGTDRSRLGRMRSSVSMGRPVLPPEKLEQLPGLLKPESSARLVRPALRPLPDEVTLELRALIARRRQSPR